jgi:hypothetical protein
MSDLPLRQRSGRAGRCSEACTSIATAKSKGFEDRPFLDRIVPR